MTKPDVLSYVVFEVEWAFGRKLVKLFTFSLTSLPGRADNLHIPRLTNYQCKVTDQRHPVQVAVQARVPRASSETR